MFLSNKSLLHLDLSVCGFTKQDCSEISIGLNENHTMLGFHFNGNEMEVDEFGFLSINSADDDPIKTSFMKPISEKLIWGLLHKHESEVKISSNCWICEGWTEHYFSIESKNCNIPMQFNHHSNVYIHFNSNNYQPLLMNFVDSNTQKWYFWKTISGDVIKYYFSLDGVQFIDGST